MSEYHLVLSLSVWTFTECILALFRGHFFILSVFCQVCVYVNHSCNCGPTLVPSRVAKLPLQFGPSLIRRTLRQTLQSIVDSAADPNAVFGLLQEGSGRVVISGAYFSWDFSV